MRQHIPTSVRGLLVALVALVALGATGVSSHAHGSAGSVDESGQPVRDVGADPTTDHFQRRIDLPLPFLAGTGALETLFETGRQVSIRTSARTDTVNLDDDADPRPAGLSQLRIRLATREYLARARSLAFARHGSLHGFSTPPPV